MSHVSGGGSVDPRVQAAPGGEADGVYYVQVRQTKLVLFLCVRGTERERETDRQTEREQRSPFFFKKKENGMEKVNLFFSSPR